MANYFSALACCFTSLLHSYRRTANGRPYGSVFFAALSFRQWQSPKTVAGHNRAVAIAHMPFLTRIGRLPRPSIARPLLPEGLFGLRLVCIIFAPARPAAMAKFLFCTRALNDIVRIVFASARPVIMAVVVFALALCFTSLRIFTGGRPMAAPTAVYFLRLCHLDNGNLRKPSQDIFGI